MAMKRLRRPTVHASWEESTGVVEEVSASATRTASQATAATSMGTMHIRRRVFGDLDIRKLMPRRRLAIIAKSLAARRSLT